MKIAKIQSSEKDGTEKAALDAAKKIGIITTGWKPLGSVTTHSGLKETSSKNEDQCVVWNVRDSHATLIIGSPESSKTTSLAFEVAQAYNRPYLISDKATEIINWLNTLEEEITLNVTGPTEREEENITGKVKSLMSRIFSFYDSYFVEE